MHLWLKNKKTLGITIAASIFAIGGLVHLVRLITGISLVVAGHEVPLFCSVIALVVAWSMAHWLWAVRSD